MFSATVLMWHSLYSYLAIKQQTFSFKQTKEEVLCRLSCSKLNVPPHLSRPLAFQPFAQCLLGQYTVMQRRHFSTGLVIYISSQQYSMLSLGLGSGAEWGIMVSKGGDYRSHCPFRTTLLSARLLLFVLFSVTSWLHCTVIIRYAMSVTRMYVNI